MIDSVRHEFGDQVQVAPPMGGIYVWLTFPEGTDTDALLPAAKAAGIEFNPGSGWSSDSQWGKRRLRLCFGAADVDTIRSGVAELARVYQAS